MLGRHSFQRPFTKCVLRSNIARMTVTTFHRRKLPDNLLPLNSPLGRERFRESLLKGDMECFFPLSEQFITQSEPSFCSLSSLAMVLNALDHDPQRTWKVLPHIIVYTRMLSLIPLQGVWRWVSEETLLCHAEKMCVHSADKIRTEGMDFRDFEALGHCHGVQIQSFGMTTTTLTAFRELVLRTSRSAEKHSFVICNFSRQELCQTGDGHFSPIGGYHEATDSVLILDVARFKYPPYWVSIESLWSAMLVLDGKTGSPRGYFLVSASAPRPTDDSGHHHHHHEHQSQCGDKACVENTQTTTL